MHRVLMARSLCDGKDVLDIASGEGYCSAYIAQVARNVVGVEIDATAVEYAAARYGSDNLRYICGTAQQIPLDDASVDVVVSFETIEHFSDHTQFLSEIRRVLRPGGLAMISTPDLAIYSVDGEPANPYHVQEMTRDEYRTLINGAFAHAIYLGQRTMVGSALVTDAALTRREVEAPFLTYEARGWNAFERSAGLSRTRYIVALASDDPAALAQVEQSVFIATSEIDKAVGLHDNLQRDLSQAQARIAEHGASEARWRNDIETVTGWFEGAKQDAVRLRNELEQAGREAATARDLSLTLDVARHESREQITQIEQLTAELNQEREDRQDVTSRFSAEIDALSGALDQAVQEHHRATATWQRRENRQDDEIAEARELLDRARTDLAEIHRLRADDDIEMSLLSRIVADDGADVASPDRLLAKARAAARTTDHGHAERLFRMAIAINPSVGEAWRGYADSLYRQGAYRAALGAWQRALSLNDRDSLAWFGAGRTLADMGRHGEALVQWKAALAIDPGRREIGDRLEAAGVTSAQMTDIVLASPVIARVVAEGQSAVLRWPTMLKVRAALREGKPRRAVRLYRLLAERSGQAGELLRYGDATAALAGLADARAIYFRAYTMAPDNVRVRRRMMDVRTGDFGFRLHPKIDLRMEPDGAYQTLSDDPQFDLDTDGRPMPSGWTLISISGDARGAPIRPVVYAYHGDRERTITAFTFPPIAGRTTVRCLLPLPGGIKRLRLDPTGESHVTFYLDRVGWSTDGALDGLAFEPIASGDAFVGETPTSAAPDIRPMPAFPLDARHQLAPLEDDGFEASGNDPQFEVVGGSTLSGWTWLELRCDDMDAPLDPMLYAFTEDDVVTVYLPELPQATRVRVLVRLPDRVSRLRFDPTTRAGARFSLPVFHACPAPPVDQVLTPSAAIAWADEPGEHIVTCTVRPEQQLEPLGGDRFRSVGEDPQFLLSAGDQVLPGGLVRMTLRIDALDQPVDATLYAFPDADRPPYSYTLRALTAGHNHEFHLVLPEPVRMLRFDPCDQPGLTFGTPQITLTQIRSGNDAQYELAEGERLPETRLRAAVTAILRPQHHLEGDAAAYRTSGNDPQFGISLAGQPFPGGWSVVTFDVTSTDTVLKPILYCWAGDAMTQVSLGDVDTGSVSRRLVHLPAGLTAMRLDCTDLPDICFSEPRLSFAPAEAVAGHLLRRLATRGRGLDYRDWCETYDRITPEDRVLIAASVERLAERPLISVVMPVYNPEPRFLRRALDSVIDQLYPDWELCIAEDCSPNPEIRDILQAYADRDPRIKLVFRTENGHISLASNSALELVSGTFVALMDHDDELPAHALYMVAHELNRFPDADILYSDEDKIDANGRRHDPHFKTDWNRELFYSQNMVAHLGVYRTSLVHEIGGFRAGFEGSQDYDFTLRILRLTAPERIRHIPHVLYHWRIFEGVRTFSSNNPDRSIATAERAMRDYFDAVEPNSEVVPLEAFPSWWRIKRPVPDTAPSVTIIIPTRDHIALLRNCVDGVLNRTDYPDLDIVIVDNGSTEADSLGYLATIAEDPRVTVLRDDGPFNYSRLNNEAVAIARGDYVCFLNNDIETIAPDWLSELVAQVVQPGVGAVGTKLLYASGKIQHAGITIGVYGVAAHGHRHFDGDSIGYFGHPQLVREVSGVTAAALLMPKALFDSLGGFDEANLAVSYNDVDLCLRIREAGHRIIYTPFAALYHLESASRGPDVTPEKKELQRIERGYMQARWGKLLEHDPYYSPNLSLGTEDYHIAFPPRAPRPWIEEADVAEQLARAGRAALPEIAAADVAALARDTVIVIACSAPFVLLTALAEDMRAARIRPAEIVLVDNSARTRAFVRTGALAAFAKAHDDVPLRVIDDPVQDFNASRTANIGVAATDPALGHVLLITEDCALTHDWFDALLRSWLAAGDRDALLSPILFVRENVPHYGVLSDGYVETPVAQIATSPSAVLAMGEDYAGLPRATRTVAGQVKSDDAIAPRALPPSGIVMARRSVLAGIVDADGVLFDPLLYTPAARLEDLARRADAGILAAMAPVAVLAQPRPRDREHLWQYWHDYLWLNRKVHGVPDDGVVEFVCPFHRGDVLIGLQVAHTAHLAGRRIRFHVAESLLDWVTAFDPPFPVRGLPVPVPPATETAFYLLRSYEHLLRQSDTGPNIARSHPVRGLDEMNNNLATAMLVAVGLSADTPIEALVPAISADHWAEADALLAPFGDRVLLLHRAGGWGLKSLPDAVLDRFARTVAAKGFRLVQIGGPADKKCQQAVGMIAGDFAVGVWAALFRRVAAVAGIDSWTAHMASLLDVPQITFFGSTHPDHVASKRYFRSQSAPALLIPPTVACSPCNSLVCLYQPELYCLGYSADEMVIAAFFDRLEA